MTSSPQGWVNDSDSSDNMSDADEEETDEYLMKQALKVISSSCNQTQSSPIVCNVAKQTISDNSQLSTETVKTPTKKRTRQEYEIDLIKLNESKAKMMKLEHELLKTRYDDQTLQEAFLNNYYKSSPSDMNECVFKKTEPSTLFIPTTTSKLMNPSRGYSNYHAFMKICKTILPGSIRIKRSYFKALWYHQKTCLNAFFKTNHVSSADGKAMNDNDAYSNHVTKVVAPLMKQTMPYYTRMILLYDSNVTENENLKNLSSLCALPLFVQLWTNTTLSTNQYLLESIWNAFGGLIDLHCQQHNVSEMFPKTLTDDSTAPLTNERLRNEIAPSIAKAMPYLQELISECTENITKTDIEALVIQAKKSLHG